MNLAEAYSLHREVFTVSGTKNRGFRTIFYVNYEQLTSQKKWSGMTKAGATLSYIPLVPLPFDMMI